MLSWFCLEPTVVRKPFGLVRRVPLVTRKTYVKRVFFFLGFNARVIVIV